MKSFHIAVKAIKKVPMCSVDVQNASMGPSIPSFQYKYFTFFKKSISRFQYKYFTFFKKFILKYQHKYITVFTNSIPKFLYKYFPFFNVNLFPDFNADILISSRIRCKTQWWWGFITYSFLLCWMLFLSDVTQVREVTLGKLLSQEIPLSQGAFLVYGHHSEWF